LTKLSDLREPAEAPTAVPLLRAGWRTILTRLVGPWWLLPATALGVLGAFAGFYAQFSTRPKASQVVLSGFSSLTVGVATYVTLLALVLERERRLSEQVPKRSSIPVHIGYLQADQAWAEWAGDALDKLPDVRVTMHALSADAFIDGASHWTVFRRIVLPLAGPALATFGIFAFMASWNSFLWPLVVTSSQDLFTLPVGLSNLHGRYETAWNLDRLGPRRQIEQRAVHIKEQPDLPRPQIHRVQRVHSPVAFFIAQP